MAEVEAVGDRRPDRVQTRACDRCKRRYVPKRYWQRFCRPECRYAYRHARVKAQQTVRAGGVIAAPPLPDPVG